MRCRKIKKWIPLYVSKDLESDQVEQINAHLRGCAACQHEVEVYQWLRVQSGDMQAVKIKENEETLFFESVWRRVNHSFPKTKRRIFRPAIATLAIIVVAFCIWTYQSHAPHRSLSNYLIEEDYEGLYRAFQNSSQQQVLLKETVSTRLLIQAAENCDPRVLRMGLPKMIAAVEDIDVGDNLDESHLIEEIRMLKHIDRMPSKVTLNQILEWTHSRNAL